jgi:hypothetical protein
MLAAFVVALVVAACSGSASPTPAAPVFTNPPDLTDAQSAWCILHTGGPGDDAHQVEDMALQLGLIANAKTRDDVFGRWAGHSPSDPEVTYKIACIAAFAAFGASPGAS